MAFGGQMHDPVGLERFERRAHRRGVADVALHEMVARVGGDRRERGQIAGIGQLVEHEQRMRRLAE